MVRRVATQVHRQVARLLLSNFIRNEPVWYQAVLDHPPIPLPPRAAPSRSTYDLPSGKRRGPAKSHKPEKEKALPIVYVEDEVRRQFFQDHPFEAFRERTLVEGRTLQDEHPIKGEAWTRLSQRTRNPSSEDAVRFTVNMHLYHKITLPQAYAIAVSQFRSLRSEHQIATSVAAAEVKAYGGSFGPNTSEIGFSREEQNLKSWESSGATEQESHEARKRWRAIVGRTNGVGTWSRGEDYVRLWKEGIRPNYAPALSVQPVAASAPEVDFIGLTQHMEAAPAPANS